MRSAWVRVSVFVGLAGCAGGGELSTSGVPATTTTGLGTTEETGTSGPGTTTGGETTEAVATTEAVVTTDDSSGSSGSQVTSNAPKCGDGNLDPLEECDDGNLLNNDACTNACAAAVCGDGFVLAGSEECDDGNGVDGDACTNACAAAVCGDGVVQLGIEACDDGNQSDMDACTSECALAGCGDGLVNMGVEECDDANADNTDACTASCKNAVCGDGILWVGVEECEDGNMIAGDGCENDCTKTKINKYTALGPQVNVAAAQLVGWTECYVDVYANNGTSVQSILQTCNKANLMLACRQKGSATFTLLAHAPRSEVTKDTMQSNTPTVANGAGWYFSDGYSWGFARQGDPIQRTSCDTAAANPEQRLCWHTGGGAINGGWRCGTTTNLNGDGSWERVVLHAD